MTSPPKQPAKAAGVRLAGSKPGDISRGLAAAVKSAESDGRSLDPLLLALAKRTAMTADAAWRADASQLFLTAATKLELLARRLGLTVALESPGGGEEGDDDGSQRDAVDDELAELLGSGPTLGDTADS